MSTISFNASSQSMLSRLNTVLRFTLTIVIFGFIAAAGWKLNQQLHLTHHLFTYAFLLGTVLAIVYRLLNPIGWALLLRGMGFSVNRGWAVRVWLHAESRRWLPGGVWGYASRAVASKELGVPKIPASASMLIELIVTMVASLLMCLLGIVFCWEVVSTAVRGLQVKPDIIHLFVAGTVSGLIFLTVVGFFSRNFVGNAFSKIATRFELLRSVKLSPGMLLGPTAFFVAMACLNGLVNQSLLLVWGSQLQVPLIGMIAATAAAWIIGFFAFFSPGGILVREAALAGLLLPWLPYETGFALAILSRFAQLIAEVAGMIFIMVIPRGASQACCESNSSRREKASYSD